MSRIQSRSSRRRSIIDRLESRFIPGAVLALGPEGVLFDGPGNDLLEGLVVEHQAAAPAEASAMAEPDASLGVLPSDLSPEEDPLSPVGDPAPGETGGEEAGGGGAVASSTCGGCGGPLMEVNVIHVGDYASEAVTPPATPGKFKFSVAPVCQSEPNLPTSATITFNVSGIAEKGVDYDGDIATTTSVTIPLTNGYGSKELGYTAIPDLLDEPTEDVIVTISNVTFNAPATQQIITYEGYGAVQSGDYTLKGWQRNSTNTGWDPAIQGAGTTAPIVEIGSNNNFFPGTTRQIAIEVQQNGVAVPNVEVSLARLDAISEDGVAVIKVLNGGNPDNSAKATTNAQGNATFTLVYVSGNNGGAQRFEASVFNADGEKQNLVFICRIIR